MKPKPTKSNEWEKFELLHDIIKHLKKVEAKMSELSDKLKGVSEGVSAVKQGLTDLGTSLTAEIQAIKDKITAGGVTPADLAALDALAADVTAMGTTVKGLDEEVKAIVE